MPLPDGRAPSARCKAKQHQCLCGRIIHCFGHRGMRVFRRRCRLLREIIIPVQILQLLLEQCLLCGTQRLSLSGAVCCSCLVLLSLSVGDALQASLPRWGYLSNSSVPSPSCTPPSGPPGTAQSPVHDLSTVTPYLKCNDGHWG